MADGRVNIQGNRRMGKPDQTGRSCKKYIGNIIDEVTELTAELEKRGIYEINKFKGKYNNNSHDIKIARFPLRICPLGAHVDHQEGLVTGMALDSSVDMVFTPNDDGYIRVQSLDFPDEEYFHIDNAPEMIPGFWGNYLRGAVLSLKRKYFIKRVLMALSVVNYQLL